MGGGKNHAGAPLRMKCEASRMGRDYGGADLRRTLVEADPFHRSRLHDTQPLQALSTGEP